MCDESTEDTRPIDPKSSCDECDEATVAMVLFCSQQLGLNVKRDSQQILVTYRGECEFCGNVMWDNFIEDEKTGRVERVGSRDRQRTVAAEHMNQTSAVVKHDLIDNEYPRPVMSATEVRNMCGVDPEKFLRSDGEVAAIRKARIENARPAPSAQWRELNKGEAPARKPPLGVLPRELWDVKRLCHLLKAMQDYGIELRDEMNSPEHHVDILDLLLDWGDEMDEILANLRRPIVHGIAVKEAKARGESR